MDIKKLLKSSSLFLSALLLMVVMLRSDSMAQKEEVITLGNEFVEIVVNNSEDGQGRFAMNTTGGDPSTSTDDRKPLIYGRPIPWTSYTSVMIDDKLYVFGGESAKSAGRGGLLGEVSKPPQKVRGADGERIVASWRMGKILVEQSLSLDKSPFTGEIDTMKIEYVVVNEDTVLHNVGLRMMFDTMLGGNDAAPFRVKEKALLTSVIYSGDNIPDFWQAFDSLKSPTIVAQGTLRGKEATPPDRVIFSDWGTLASELWDKTVVQGADFIRKGEYEPDTAIALLWDPLILAPGEERRYITYYGLGSLTIAPGSLSIGVTSPGEVVADMVQPRPFMIVAYLENLADKRALQVNVDLKLPKGLALWEGSAPSIFLGNIDPAESRQLVWYVYATGEKLGSIEYEVSVTSTNTESNFVKRRLEVVGPPFLTSSLEYPPYLEVKDDRLYPFWIVARLKNEGRSSAYGVKALLTTSRGLELVPLEKGLKYLSEVKVGEEETVEWRVVPSGVAGTSHFDLEFSSINALKVTGGGDVEIPELTSKLRVGDGKAKVVTVGDIIILDIGAVNLPSLSSVSFDISFDPKVLEVLKVSRGTAFVEGNRLLSWTEPEITEGRIAGIGLNRSTALGVDFSTIVTIYLRAKGPGFTEIALENPSIDGSGEDEDGLTFTLSNGRIGVIQGL